MKTGAIAWFAFGCLQFIVGATIAAVCGYVVIHALFGSL